MVENIVNHLRFMLSMPPNNFLSLIIRALSYTSPTNMQELLSSETAYTGENFTAVLMYLLDITYVRNRHRQRA